MNLVFLKSLYDDNERLAAQLKKSILDAVEAIKSETDTSAVIRALEAGDLEGALDALAFEVGEARMAAAVPAQLRTAYETAAGLERQSLAEALDVPVMNIRFDITNPVAVEFVRTNGADLIKEFGDSSKETLRQLIIDAMTRTGEDSISPQQLARQIITSGIGITERSKNALENYRRGLEAETNLTDAQIEAQVEKLAAKYLRDRAETVARTEIMTASRAGSQGLWWQAKEQGLLTDEAIQVWVTDIDPCPRICADLKGATAKLGESFPGGGGDGPPAHPRCECSLSLLPYGVKEGN